MPEGSILHDLVFREIGRDLGPPLYAPPKEVYIPPGNYDFKNVKLFRPDIPDDPNFYVILLLTNKDWYLDPSFLALNRDFVVADAAGKPEEWQKVNREVVRMETELLRAGQIILGTATAGYNDDDRGKHWVSPDSNVVEPERRIDTVVMHYTGTPADMSMEDTWHLLNALGLFRVWVPAAAGLAFKTHGADSISSGHYLADGRQVWFAYHVVMKDGRFYRLLNDWMTGLHAGDYKTACQSLGFALVKSDHVTAPSGLEMEQMARLTALYNPKILIGHKEVNHNGKPVGGVCPGDWWNDRKKQELRQRAAILNQNRYALQQSF